MKGQMSPLAPVPDLNPNSSSLLRQGKQDHFIIIGPKKTWILDFWLPEPPQTPRRLVTWGLCGGSGHPEAPVTLPRVSEPGICTGSAESPECPYLAKIHLTTKTNCAIRAPPKRRAHKISVLYLLLRGSYCFEFWVRHS